MPYSGGSSMHAGARYQNWYLALLISYAFFEVDNTIHPEAFTVVDDIKVKDRLGTTFYSAKYRSPSKKLHWNQSDLCSQKIFSNFKKQHEANPEAKIVLVSESNCYLFAEVFNRARNTEPPIDIHTALDSNYVRGQWEEAKQYLGYNDFQLINFAKKVDIRCLPLIEIKNLIKHRFTNTSNQNSIKTLFYDKACEYSSNRRRIRKVDINQWLIENDINLD